MNLARYDYNTGNPEWVKDACGILFDHSNWTAKDASPDGVNFHDSGCGHDLVYEEYPPTEGLAAGVKVDNDAPDYCGFSLETDLVRDHPNQARQIQFRYEHTKTASPTGSVSIGICAGALCVQTSFSSYTAWSDEVTDHLPSV